MSALAFRDLAEIDVGRLKGVGEKKRVSLASIGVDTLLDLVTFYPRRWVDRSNEARIADLVAGEEALVLATVRSVTKRVTRNRRTMVNVNVGDGSGRMEVVFFNQPWRERQLREGLQIALFGRSDVYRGGLQMANPVVDLIGDRTGRIVPIYPQSEKVQINTWEIAGWVEETLRRCRERGIADPVPQEILQRLGMLTRFDALSNIHLPESIRDKEQARRRLAFDELLRVQLVLVLRKRAMERDQRGIAHDLSGDLVQRFHDALPYPLTGAQQRAIAEIEHDLAAPHPMHRLLQGDVGSGKTVVAVDTMMVAVQGGHQAALMAPTEVLAEQHATGVRALLDGVSVPDPGNLFGDRPLRVELLTNRVTGTDRKDVLAGLADGSVDIVIGTHALLYDAVAFRDLGLVVIDEQHKFGVAQRARLIRQGVVPDVLVMTATPIPRTLTLTVYGDLDVSVLDEKPPGRGQIVTAVRVAAKQSDVTKFVKAQLAEGRQAYLVYPLVEESESLRAESATEAFPKWKKRLGGHEVGMIHGKLRPEEKESVMRRFREGETAALVATTVIEVGVDVPNASVMILHHAERFGLAQLHQLRGRIGRGGHKGYCILLTDGRNPDGLEKLKVLERTSDGFEIAEADLRLRGPGDVLGTVQSGLTDLRFADFLADTALLREARALADLILSEDPHLDGIHRSLRESIQSALPPRGD